MLLVYIWECKRINGDYNNLVSEMVVASHYVLKDIKRILDMGDMERLRDTTNRYRELYSEDAELQRISGEINRYLLSGSKEDWEELRSEISDSRAWFRRRI